MSRAIPQDARAQLKVQVMETDVSKPKLGLKVPPSPTSFNREGCQQEQVSDNCLIRQPLAGLCSVRVAELY